MATLRRIRAGHTAKRAGQIWEQTLEYSATKAGITLIRIPDSCRVTRGPAGVRLTRITSPFDYVLLYKTQAVVCDAKSIDSNRFPYSSITPHQMHSLHRCHYNAARSGYLVHLRPIDKVVFISSSILKEMRPRESISPDQAIDLGQPSRLNLRLLFNETVDSWRHHADIINYGQ